MSQFREIMRTWRKLLGMEAWKWSRDVALSCEDNMGIAEVWESPIYGLRPNFFQGIDSLASCLFLLMVFLMEIHLGKCEQVMKQRCQVKRVGFIQGLLGAQPWEYRCKVHLNHVPPDYKMEEAYSRTIILF